MPFLTRERKNVEFSCLKTSYRPVSSARCYPHETVGVNAVYTCQNSHKLQCQQTVFESVHAPRFGAAANVRLCLFSSPPCVPADMLNDFVVVTLTRPGPLYVRLRPDARGLVVVNNFESVPDDLHTGCPRLGPIESVGMVMPGDALVSRRARYAVCCFLLLMFFVVVGVGGCDAFVDCAFRFTLVWEYFCSC